MAVFPCDLTCSFLLYRTSQLKGQKGDFLFIIQPRRTAEALLAMPFIDIELDKQQNK